MKTKLLTARLIPLIIFVFGFILGWFVFAPKFDAQHLDNPNPPHEVRNGGVPESPAEHISNTPDPRFGGDGYEDPVATSTVPEPVACTMDAKMCPDGSYVGRTGPHCEFAPCPAK